MKNLWLVIGLSTLAAVPLTAEAGGRCNEGKSRCFVATAAPSIQHHGQEASKNEVSSAHAFHLKPRIAPIWTMPAGQTYGRWAAEWWQWVLGIPSAVNPLMDTTGEHCAQRQVDEVWFLAGSGAGPVVRACEVPAGKSLFFPLINTFYGAFLNDDPATRTEEFIRTAGSCSEPAQISVKIDGVNVVKPARFFTGSSGSQSPFFNVQLPPHNLFGLEDDTAFELALSPNAEQGYYLFVQPMRPGTHTLQWSASGCTPGNSQEVTYNLTVLGSE